MPCPAAFLPWLAAQPALPLHPEPDYHHAAEIYGEIAALVEDYPGVIQPECVGESVEGRPIWAFHVRDPGRISHGSMLVFAGIHALEWVPAEIALAWLRVSVTERRAVDLTVIPLLNPDGRARAEADQRAGENRYRRGNAAQVDLNRDFAVYREAEAIWKGVLPGYYHTSPAPLSQPESQALDRLAASRRYDTAVSLHSFGGFLYYPWAGRFARAPDWQEYHRIGRVMQAAMGPHAYRPRQLSRWGFFFRAQGTELDHLYGTYGAWTFLVETTRSGIARFEDRKTYFRWYNPRDPAYHITQGVRLLRALAIEVEADRVERRDPPDGPPDKQ